MSSAALHNTDVPAAVIAGLGTYVPDHLVKNEEIALRLGVTSDWITERTGIQQRYVIEPTGATSDLAVEAGRRALESYAASCAARAEAAGTDSPGSAPEEIGFLILATCTPDHTFPSTAPAVASRLGLTGIAAFDLGAACSGFVYALTVGAGLLAGGAFKAGLVIGADACSTIIDHDDKVTAPIFGDGAGAVVIRAGRADEPGALMSHSLGSDGGNLDLLVIPGGGSRQRGADVPPDPATSFIGMQGRLVYRNAVNRMSEASVAVLDRMGWSPQDVDCMVAHQANQRILTATAESIGIPSERAVVNVDRVANTSAASIPLALADALADGELEPGHRVLLAAFGGGLTWAAGALIWPELTVAGHN